MGRWFGDANMSGTLPDRRTYHCDIVEAANELWRFQHSNTAAVPRICSREPSKRAGPRAPETDALL